MTPLFAAATTSHFPLLTATLVLPALGAIVVALLPRGRSDLVKVLGLAFSVGTFVFTIAIVIAFKTHPHLGQTGNLGLAHAEGFQLVDRAMWIKPLGIHWFLGVDGISLWLVVLTGLLFPLGFLGADAHKNYKAYTAWLLLLEFGCIGTFLALDLFVFFVMFEIVLVPMYFLIIGWGYDQRRYAGIKFFLYTMLGSAFMLVGLVTLVALHASKTGHLTFDVVQIAHDQSIATTTARWLFLAFGIAFAVKVPLFPVHTWLPDAHTQAPTAGSVILAGVMLKLGTYGFLRFGLYLFPEAAVYWAPLMVTLGVIGILYGAITAAMQHDLKRVVAYSSVAHLGFIALGTFALTTQGLSGGVFQMVNHGITTPALFLLVGWIYERRHTREIAALGGLQKKAPILAGVFIFTVFASIGLPGLNGFAGEFLILIGSFLTRRWWAVVAAIGVILAAVYLLWAYQRVFHGTPSEENEKVRDMNWRELAVMAPLMALMLFLGLYPKPLLSRVEPSVNRLISHVEDHSSYHQPKRATHKADLPRGAEPAGDGWYVYRPKPTGSGK